MEYFNVDNKIIPLRIQCDFCNRRAAERSYRFIRGPYGTFVCEECVLEMAEMLERAENDND